MPTHVRLITATVTQAAHNAREEQRQDRYAPPSIQNDPALKVGATIYSYAIAATSDYHDREPSAKDYKGAGSYRSNCSPSRSDAIQLTSYATQHLQTDNDTARAVMGLTYDYPALWFTTREEATQTAAIETFTTGHNGGYPTYAIAGECVVLCLECAKKELGEALADEDHAIAADVIVDDSYSDAARESSQECEGCNAEIYPQLDYLSFDELPDYDATQPHDTDIFRDENHGYVTTARNLAEAVQKGEYTKTGKRTYQETGKSYGPTFTREASNQDPTMIHYRHHKQQQRNATAQDTRDRYTIEQAYPAALRQLENAADTCTRLIEKLTAAGYSHAQPDEEIKAGITHAESTRRKEEQYKAASARLSNREISYEQFKAEAYRPLVVTADDTDPEDPNQWCSPEPPQDEHHPAPVDDPIADERERRQFIADQEEVTE